MATVNFSGLASGIDFESLIKATSDATRAQRVLPSQKKVQDITDTNSALSELKTKLTTLQSKAKAFASINGGALAKQATTSDETVITASASNAAPNGQYSITVTQLAKGHTMSFNDRFAASDSVVAPTIADPATNTATHTRELAITAGTNSTFYVDISPTTKLSDIADAINSANKGVIASIVNTGQSPNPYALVLKSTDTGATNGLITVTTGTDINAVTLFQNKTQDTPQDASFTITGVSGTITSATNSVSSVIPGVTFNLIASSASAVTITVSDDVSATTAKISEFVSSFNAIIEMMAENNKVERLQNGEKVTNVFGPLSISRIDENAITAIKDQMTASRYANGSYVKIFADLGIYTNRDGTLEFKTDKFTENLAKDPTGANQVLKTFADAVALTGGTLDQYVAFNKIIDAAITNNKDQITDLNDRIAEAEAQIARTETSMRARFSRLESLTAKLQQQGAAAANALAGLGR